MYCLNKASDYRKINNDSPIIAARLSFLVLHLQNLMTQARGYRSVSVEITRRAPAKASGHRQTARLGPKQWLLFTNWRRGGFIKLSTQVAGGTNEPQYVCDRRTPPTQSTVATLNCPVEGRRGGLIQFQAFAPTITYLNIAMD